MNIKNRIFDKTLSYVIMKVSNICNFACPHCFMFHAVDKSYKNRPKLMSREIMIMTANRIEEYYKNTTSAETLEVVFHGGEPLMLGKKNLEFLFQVFSNLREKYPINLSLQSNGSLIDDELCELFIKHKILAGVSLDGYPEIQNKSKTIAGKDTYPLIVNGLKKIQNKLGNGLFRGLMCVIDPKSDPVRLYKHFLELGIKRMEFLLPLRNHKNSFGYVQGSKKYYNWLKKIFDQYIQDDNEEIEIRIFDSIIDILLGAQIPMCSIRHSAVDMLVIESNGSIELVDDLRICGEDFTNLNLNISQNKLLDFFQSQRVLDLRQAEIDLPEKCVSCNYFNACGSGGHAFRFGIDNNFENCSIYCEETRSLVEYIDKQIQLYEEA